MFTQTKQPNKTAKKKKKKRIQVTKKSSKFCIKVQICLLGATNTEETLECNLKVLESLWCYKVAETIKWITVNPSFRRRRRLERSNVTNRWATLIPRRQVALSQQESASFFCLRPSAANWQVWCHHSIFSSNRQRELLLRLLPPCPPRVPQLLRDPETR